MFILHKFIIYLYTQKGKSKVDYTWLMLVKFGSYFIYFARSWSDQPHPHLSIYFTKS